MPEENINDRDLRGRFEQGPGSALHRHLETTESMLVHTQSFLDRLAEGDEDTRRYVKQLKESLETDKRRLEKERSREEENETR